MSEAVLTSRVYRHKRCRQETVVGGQDFSALSNPFSFSTGTLCTACRKPYPLKEFTWVDTGETIAARRRRLRAEAPASQKLFGWVIGPVVCGLVGACIGRLVKPGDHAATAAGAGVGFFIFTFMLMPPLMKVLFKVDYRSLK